MPVLQTMRDLQAALSASASEEVRWQQALEAERAMPNGLEIVVTHSPDHGPALRRRLDSFAPERLVQLAASAPDLMDGLDDIVARWVIELTPGMTSGMPSGLPSGISAAGRDAGPPSSHGRALQGRSGLRATSAATLTAAQSEARVRALTGCVARHPLQPALLARLVGMAATPFRSGGDTARAGLTLRVALADPGLTSEDILRLDRAWSSIAGSRLLLAAHPSAPETLAFDAIADRHPDHALEVFRSSRQAWKSPQACAWLTHQLSALASAEEWSALRRWALVGRGWLTDSELQPRLLQIYSGEGGLQLACLLQLTEGQVALALPKESLKRLLTDPRQEIRELALRAIRQTATAQRVLSPETQTPESLRQPLKLRG